MSAVRESDLLRWSETLAAVARTGLAFTESLYERERFEEILHVASDMRARAADAPDALALVEEWMRDPGRGAAGYITPKLAVGAVVGNDDGEILLVRRSDSGLWLYPTGWADVGYSAAEVAVREVHEETGIKCEAVGLIAIIDGLRAGFTRIPLHSLVFHCRAVGGDLKGHPLETSDVGWFGQERLPDGLAGSGAWTTFAFEAISGAAAPTRFDAVRTPVWTGDDQDGESSKVP
jgi:ADP-ribose pyrophosphatase YjhB (NUDIX family)